jgi:hypothetical protein
MTSTVTGERGRLFRRSQARAVPGDGVSSSKATAAEVACAKPTAINIELKSSL